MSKEGLLRFLEKMPAGSPDVASLYIPPSLPEVEAGALLENILEAGEQPQDLRKYLVESPTGAVLFWGANHHFLIMPPFPLSRKRTSACCEVEPLLHLLLREYLFGLILVRLGSFAIGVVRGEVLLASKVGKGLVHARHRQGGSSAHRFERHREKQMETFFTRVCGYAREYLEPYDRVIQYMLYGGTRETLLEFQKQCHYLDRFQNRTLAVLLNIREPGQAGLNQAVREAWSSRVVRWEE